MEKLKYFIPFLLIATVYAGALIDYFNARSENEDIRLEWRSSEESNLLKYVIERRTPQSTFVEIQSVEPKGSGQVYVYYDKNAYKSNDLLFIYRLKIVDKNNVSTTLAEASVSHNVSGVKRTWGSIKAMFR